MSASSSICAAGYKYYRGVDGYMCGGGYCFVSHDDVDAMMLYGRPPFVEEVNTPYTGARCVAPPKAGWHEPMHYTPGQRITNNMEPLPLKADGTPHEMSKSLRRFMEF